MKSIAVVALTLAACVAAAPSWQVMNGDFATIAMAISCRDANTCLAPVGQNGAGSFIWLTTDGGKTWNTEQEPFELMFLGASMQPGGDTAVVADELTLIYNNASAQSEYMFSHPKSGDYFVSSQNVEFFGSNSYGAAGESEVNNGNGVSISNDGGATWSWYNVSALKTFARYGAYPSATTWYLSAGEWPESLNAPTEETYRQVSSRIHINQRDGAAMSHRLFPASEQRTAPGDNGWKAQIVKTTDGGKTWTSVFFDEGNFYFNQIGCTDVNHCCAVGEADSSATPGVRFYCTTNGGNSWTRVLYNSDPNMSVLALRWIDSKNGWAAGGDMASTGITGYFWQTTDGGNTWNAVTVPGQYANDMAFPSATKGYAVAFNQDDESSLLVFQ